MAVETTAHDWRIENDHIITPDYILYADGRREVNHLGQDLVYGSYSYSHSFSTVGENVYDGSKYKTKWTDTSIIVSGFVLKKTYARPCTHEAGLISVADSCGGISIAVYCNECSSTFVISPFDEVNKYDIPINLPAVVDLLNTGELVILRLATSEAYLINGKTCVYIEHISVKHSNYFFSTYDEEYANEAIITYINPHPVAKRKNLRVYIVPFRASTAGKNTKMAIRKAISEDF